MTDLEIELLFAERALEQAKDRIKDQEKRTKAENENLAKVEANILKIKEAIATGQTRLY